MRGSSMVEGRAGMSVDLRDSTEDEGEGERRVCEQGLRRER
jgi:hypothetical protein